MGAVVKKQQSRGYFIIVMLWLFWNFTTRGKDKELPGTWDETFFGGGASTKKDYLKEKGSSLRSYNIFDGTVWNLNM